MSGGIGCVLALVSLIGGCATTPESEYQIPERVAGDRLDQMERWMAGEFDARSLPEATVETVDPIVERDEATSDSAAVSQRELIREVTAAEMLYWSGDIERAFDLFARVVTGRPGHPMARFAAARLYQLRDRLVDYRQRMGEVLEHVRYADVGPLTRVELSLAAQTVAYRRWKTQMMTEAPEPFAADSVGFPARWRVTPALSTMPVAELDREFAPETTSRLADSYLSPWYARPDAQNREPIRPYNSDGLSLSPSLHEDGVYYLETFVDVEQKEGEEESRDGLPGRTYWVYGSFSGGADVWIDGQRILSRRTGNYGTSKRLRRVRLEPGTHRILVKLGYESGYRDWIDLAFLGDDARPLEGSGVTFSRRLEDDTDAKGNRFQSGSGVERLSEQVRPSVLERLRVPGESVNGRTDPVALYWTAVAGTLEHQPEVFEPAWTELMDRYPDFAAGHALKAKQVRTLWELPADTRRAKSTSRLKKAHDAEPHNVYYLTRMVDILRRQGADNDQIRRQLQLARQAAFTGDGATFRENAGADEPLLRAPDRRGRLKTIEPLERWASWLADKGWSGEAEKAWRAVLSLEPEACGAAGELQSILYARDQFPGLDEITSEHEGCPDLKWRWSQQQAPSQVADYQLEYRRRQAERHPLEAGRQIALADEYRRRGEQDESKKVLKRAQERLPRNAQLYRELAGEAFEAAETLADAREAASAVLLDGLRAAGSSMTLLRKLGWLQERAPLQSYLRDGREVVREHLAGGESEQAIRGPGGDDSAYFVLDFAVRKYLPDGASLTLTHTITRVMTKGAIDRFGEQSIPSNEYLLRARSIDPDGTVEVPDRSAGKSTLSMPGLDEGDFVELAWVQYQPPSELSETHLEDMRFFFRMPDISSMHSEYIVLGPDGMKFVRRNEPPDGTQMDRSSADSAGLAGYGFQTGVRLFREESSRPRSEPYSVDGEEFLPWVQMYRRGVSAPPFELRRRHVRDRLERVLQVSDELREKASQWRAGTKPGSMEEIKQVYYRVSDHVTQGDYLDFGRDASHVAVTGEGSRLVLLKAVYDLLGIDSDVYLVKSKYASPSVSPVGEFTRYSRGVLRVRTPAGVRWVTPNSRDSMFGAIPVGSVGQPAVCVTCASDNSERRGAGSSAPRIRASVPNNGFRDNAREIDIDGELDEEGRLTGTTTMTFHGIRAVNVRKALRQRTDDTERRSYFDSVISNVVSGASLQSFSIENEEEPDRPLIFEIDFVRDDFARPVDAGGSDGASGGASALRIQTSLFGTPLASWYGSLASRQRPLMIGRQRNDRQTLTVSLPEGYSAEVGSRSGDWSYDSGFGEFERSVSAGAGTIEMSNRLYLPIQRVSTERYGSFRKWATNVEKSARLLISVNESVTN